MSLSGQPIKKYSILTLPCFFPIWFDADEYGGLGIMNWETKYPETIRVWGPDPPREERSQTDQKHVLATSREWEIDSIEIWEFVGAHRGWSRDSTVLHGGEEALPHCPSFLVQCEWNQMALSASGLNDLIIKTLKINYSKCFHFYLFVLSPST